MSLRERLFGKPKKLDAKAFHQISLVAFFAWVGLGADGLSSSAYGPEEAFRHLHGHTYLAVFLALAMGLTVFVISYGYSRVIEQFPHGGGGYLVASKLLGEKAGVVSGSALLVDYVLTISISVASGANAVFAFLPPPFQAAKFATEAIVIGLLVWMNLRGVKESVVVLLPVFLIFLVSHIVLIGGVILPHLGDVGNIVEQVNTGLEHDLSTMGLWALVLVFLRAYSMGGGTFTGIEAVSNGLSIMREPRVETGKRTMVMTAASLALTAAGIILAYLLLGTKPSGVEPMNAVLAKQFAGEWEISGIPIGRAFVIITLFSEGALLFVAAQSGFLAGPRVMANMALDSWMPHQFAALSERLTMRNGVYLLGGAALATLIYTKGDVHTLVTMYSINVFLTFSLSNLGMTRFFLTTGRKEPRWRRHLSMHLVGLTLCAGILLVTIYEKFLEGGWITLLITGVTIAVCYGVRGHYNMVANKVRKLNLELEPGIQQLPTKQLQEVPEIDPEKPTAVLLAGGFSGLGVRTLQQIQRLFPSQFQQVVFISAGVIDSGTFKGTDEIAALKKSITGQLEQYVDFAKKKLGWAADFDMVVGTEAVSELERLCREVYLRFPRSVFFAGKLIFREPSWWHRLLHNETAHAVQRRLEFDGLPMVIVPVRVLK